MKKLTLITIISSIVLMGSCKKDPDNTTTTPVVTPTTGTLYLHLHTDIDTNEVVAGAIARDSSGRHFLMNVAQFYFSSVSLKRTDGTFYTVPGAIILKNIANEEYLIGDVPAGNYTTVSFKIGVDSATNQTSPSAYASSSVLSAQTPSMYFGSGQGYIFMNVQGMADTTTANAGTVASTNVPISYQVGTNSLLKTVTMPNNPFYVTAGQSQIVHIIADYGKLLKGINFKTTASATPFTNLSAATQIATNSVSMFRYEY